MTSVSASGRFPNVLSKCLDFQVALDSQMPEEQPKITT